MKTIYKVLLSSLASLLVLSACQTTQTVKDGNGNVFEVPKPLGPVTVDGSCEQKDEHGYYDKIKVKVKENVVSELDWTARPRGAACRFQLKNFTQTSSAKQAELESKKDKKCHIYVWHDQRHVTVAVYNCKKICGQNDRLLPVLLTHEGKCKPAGNDNNLQKK